MIEKDFINITKDMNIDIFVNRIHCYSPLNSENLIKMSNTVTEVSNDILPDEKLDCIVYGCTSGTIAAGFDLIEKKIRLAKPETKVTTPSIAAINALKKMGRNAKLAVKEKRSMMIFPQGTRVNPGISAQEKPYLPGVFFLYSQSKVPVIPVAHNAGLVWPKNSFMKYPDRVSSKAITLEILPEIPPGLPKKEFLKQLEKAIENTSNKLINMEK